MTSVTAPDPQTVVVELEFPNALLLQAYVPILPKHIWEARRSRRSATSRAPSPSGTSRRSSGPGRTRPSSGSPATSSASPGTPTTGASRGRADEVIIVKFGERRHDGPGARTGEVDYVRGVLADQFDDLKDDPNIVTVEGFANGYTELSFNTGGNEARLRRLARGPRRTSPSATRSATRSTRRRSSRRRSAATARPGSTIIPPFHDRWHVAPANPRTVRHRRGQAPSRRGGLRLDGQGRGSTRRASRINLRLTWPDSEAENATNAQFLAEWFGELGIAVDAAVTEEGKLIEDVTGPTEGEARGGRQLRHLHVGLGRRSGPDVAAAVLPDRRRSAARATATTRTRATTSCSSSSGPSPTRPSARRC